MVLLAWVVRFWGEAATMEMVVFNARRMFMKIFRGPPFALASACSMLIHVGYDVWSGGKTLQSHARDECPRTWHSEF